MDVAGGSESRGAQPDGNSASSETTMMWKRPMAYWYDTPHLVKPKNIQQINDELAILWEDGHESYYKLETLRRACPCAQCGGERDVLGNVYRGQPQKFTLASFQLKSIEPVGGYAVRPTWGDGHGTGLYTFEALRQNCPCEECAAARKR